MTNLGAVEGILFSIKEGWKNWKCTKQGRKQKSKVLRRGSTRLTQYSNSDMYHACMVTWPITWLVSCLHDHVTVHVVWRHIFIANALIGYIMVTWYGDITSCKRFHLLHDGHVLCRHNFILDWICRAANIIHSNFPTLRKVAHNQNLSLFSYRHSAKIKLGRKVSKFRFRKNLEKSTLSSTKIF